MRNILRGLFWLLLALVVLLVFSAAYAVLAVFDDFCGWVDRRFEACFGDW